MNDVERISVLTPVVTQQIQEKIDKSSKDFVEKVATFILEELNSAGPQGDIGQFFNTLSAKVITAEKLAELQAMQPINKILLSKIVNLATALLYQGPTAGLLGMMGVYTSEETVKNFIMVQAIDATNDLAKELDAIYTEDVINRALSEQ